MKEFKVGDTIVILGKPSCWSSEFSSNCPLDTKIQYPLVCKIEKIKSKQDYNWSIKAGEFGWDLATLIKQNLVTLSEQVIEIY